MVGRQSEGGKEQVSVSRETEGQAGTGMAWQDRGGQAGAGKAIQGKGGQAGTGKARQRQIQRRKQKLYFGGEIAMAIRVTDSGLLCRNRCAVHP